MIHCRRSGIRFTQQALCALYISNAKNIIFLRQYESRISVVFGVLQAVVHVHLEFCELYYILFHTTIYFVQKEEQKEDCIEAKTW